MNRQIIFIIFFLTGIFSGIFISGQIRAQDPFLDACEKVPFPFLEQAQPEHTVGKKTGTKTFSEDVPVPLDTLSRSWPDDVDGYVPNEYSQKAPEPPSVLRPRYLGPQKEPIVAVPRPIVSSSEAQPIVPPATNPNAIRQVSGPSDPFLPNQVPTFTVPPLPEVIRHDTPPPVPETFQEEYQRQKQWRQKPESIDTGNSGTRSYAVNSSHRCDELGCGLPSCGGHASNQWFLDGWIQAGSFMNTHWPDDRTNTPLYYNDRNGEVVMNQLYLSFGRRINPRKNRFDIGAQIDLLYGTDYFYTSSLGLETRRQDVLFGQRTLDPLEAASHWNSNSGKRRDGTAALYGLSMPQAFAEMFLPIGYGVTLKAGHFYSGMGLESAMAPQNFFYSHSYGFTHGMPTTLTGATATVQLGRRLSAVAGVTEGWNVFDSPTGHVNGLVGLHWKSLDKRTALSFMLHTGEDTLRDNDKRTNYVLTLRQKIGRRWHYSLEHAFGYERNGAYEDVVTDQRGPARWVSLAQYLQWQWSETLAFGFRAEWFRDDGHSRIQKSPVSMPFRELSGKDYYELTLGLNWKPTRNVTIRPEIRYDWSDVKVNGQGGAYSNFSKREMVSFAVDGVFRF